MSSTDEMDPFISDFDRIVAVTASNDSGDCFSIDAFACIKQFVMCSNVMQWGCCSTADAGAAASVFRSVQAWEAKMSMNLHSANPAEEAQSWPMRILKTAMFHDESRRAVLGKILPKISSLVKGTLKGHESCFLILGPRGIGKSQFLLLIAASVVGHTNDKTLVIYTNWKCTSVKSPAVLIQEALAAKFPSLVLERNLDAIHLFLKAHNLSVILFLDELEQLWTSADSVEHMLDVLLQLHAIGNYLHSRHIMVIATGSTAVLRTLAYNISGYPRLRDEYPLYGKTPNLNNTKYIALGLSPLNSKADLKSAVLACFHTDENFSSSATSLGLVTKVNDEYDVNEDLLQKLNFFSRGTVRFFHSALESIRDKKRLKDMEAAASFGLNTLLAQNLLEHVSARSLFDSLYNAWKSSLSAGRDHLYAALDDEELLKFRVSPQGLNAHMVPMLQPDELLHCINEAADKRLLWYDAYAREVSFLHTSDVPAYILSQRSRASEDELSEAEKMSQLCPNWPTISMNG